MNKEEFNKIRREILAKVGRVNMLLSSKKSLEQALQINEIAVDEFRFIGYDYKKETNSIRLVKSVSYEDVQEHDTQHAEVMQDTVMGEPTANQGQVITGMSAQNINMLQDLFEHYADIMEMIQAFKENSTAINKDKSIIIELPIEDDKSFRTSFRVNKTIYYEFLDFCKAHKEFTTKNLVSQALKEFMDNHS